MLDHQQSIYGQRRTVGCTKPKACTPIDRTKLPPRVQEPADTLRLIRPTDSAAP